MPPSPGPCRPGRRGPQAGKLVMPVSGTVSRAAQLGGDRVGPPAELPPDPAAVGPDDDIDPFLPLPPDAAPARRLARHRRLLRNARLAAANIAAAAAFLRRPAGADPEGEEVESGVRAVLTEAVG